MRFEGEWAVCDDGRTRPIIRGEILGAGGQWRAVELLIDTGADCTLLSNSALRALLLSPTPLTESLGGVGGTLECVSVETQIRLMRDDGGLAAFRGQFAASASPEALDISVLGRDILDLFAVIVDRPHSVACLLGGRHRYLVQPE